ncbi:transposase [Candidatus Curtissbacteria bacterium]|nr:transposase [Candidatus Curtissbacteria bacterium]
MAKGDFIQNLMTNCPVILEILGFCLMPNHFHFLLKPNDDNSISSFVRNFQDSYAKYFNTKNDRVGSLFQAMFKAVRIETDEQLLHISRYIHLNPVSSFMLKAQSLEDYPWSSFREYLGSGVYTFVNPKEILAFFKPKTRYKEFVLDQADYQQELEKIKHLTLEKP